MAEDISYQDAVFQKLLYSQLSLAAIEEELRSEGCNPDAIVEILKKVKKYRIAQRQSTGFIYMAAGAFIGFLSCVLTIADIFPGHIGIVLYGLTSIAVLLVVIGLYYVFE